MNTKRNLIVPVKTEVAGWYKVTVRKQDGSVARETDWFPNIITDIGLNRMGTGGWMSHCSVGTGSGAPVAGDSALGTFVASSSNIIQNVAAAQSSEPYYGSRTQTWRFGAGDAEGNLSEVGVGWAAGGGSLYSRALILDGGGSPTTITVLSDEFLDVTYQLRIYPPTSDTVISVDDDGPAGTSHEITIRAAAVTTDKWHPTVNSAVRLGTGSIAFTLVHSGGIGAITTSPAGSSAFRTSIDEVAYSNDSLQRDVVVTWGLSAGNFGGGIAALSFESDIGRFQFGLDPVIPKTSAQILNIGFRVSWARKTL